MLTLYNIYLIYLVTGIIHDNPSPRDLVYSRDPIFFTNLLGGSVPPDPKWKHAASKCPPPSMDAPVTPYKEADVLQLSLSTSQFINCQYTGTETNEMCSIV